MCSALVLEAGLDCTSHIGAEIKAFDNLPVYIGKSNNLFINEACEYAEAFLYLSSEKAAILNIDFDHIDFFKNIDNLIKCFAKFASQINNNGELILYAKDKYLAEFLKELSELLNHQNKKIKLSYFALEHDDFNKEICENADFASNFNYLIAKNIVMKAEYSSFDLYKNGEFIGDIKLAVSGEHNIKNALAALLLTWDEIDYASAKKSFAKFISADGRFSFKGEKNGAKIYTDYAHHPASTAATIQAAALLNANKTIIVYQPLTYDRVARLFDDYITSLSGKHEVLFYEIYSDREVDKQGMSSKLLAEALDARGTKACFCEDINILFNKLDEKVNEGDIVLFLGPEEVRNFASLWLKRN